MAKCTKCGKKGLTLKVSKDGLCVECLQAELDNMKKAITHEMQSAIQLQELSDSLTRKIEALHKQEEEAKARMLAKEEETNTVISQKSEQLKQLNKQIIVAEETIEMESFSLYKTRYEFEKSEEYKEKLDDNRAQQKELIKEKRAANYSTTWTVNGSKSEGRKMIMDLVKLLLRSFNNECDIAIAGVKFSNFDRCRERIEKSFETINKLGRVNEVSIRNVYLQLKIDELSLAYEYQCKKQEEKEQLRALREQQREEAKLAKEIEAARKEAEKEKKHYLQALEKLQAQYSACQSEEERAALAEKRNELLGHVDDITAKLEDIDYRQSNQKAGYVYVISNIGSFGEGIYKIGMTRRLDPMERVYELGDASVPFVFDVHAMIFSDDAPQLEAALHRAFADRRVNMVNNRREYFRVSLDEIKAVVLANHDKTVEFTDVPDAQQYRETLLMCKE